MLHSDIIKTLSLNFQRIIYSCLGFHKLCVALFFSTVAKEMALLEIQVAKYFNVSTKVWLNQLVSNLSKPLPNLLHNGRYDDRSRTVYYTSSDDILTTVNDNDVDISEGILWILMAPFFYLVFLIFLGSVIICFLSLKDRRYVNLHNL